MRIGRREFPSPLLVFFAITPVLADRMAQGTREFFHQIGWWIRQTRHQIWRRLWAFSVRASEWMIVHVLRRPLR